MCLKPVISFCAVPASFSLQSENVPLTKPVARATLTCTFSGFTLAARSLSLPSLTRTFFAVEKTSPASATGVPFGSTSVENVYPAARFSSGNSSMPLVSTWNAQLR